NLTNYLVFYVRFTTRGQNPVPSLPPAGARSQREERQGIDGTFISIEGGSIEARRWDHFGSSGGPDARAPRPPARLNLAHVGQGAAQFVRCAEEGVPGVAFAGVENSSHGAQLQALAVLHLKYRALEGGQFLERAGDAGYR